MLWYLNVVCKYGAILARDVREGKNSTQFALLRDLVLGGGGGLTAGAEGGESGAVRELPSDGRRVHQTPWRARALRAASKRKRVTWPRNASRSACVRHRARPACR